jgi:hypothetical protein
LTRTVCRKSIPDRVRTIRTSTVRVLLRWRKTVKRPVLRVAVEGPPGARDRVLQSLREMGYEVKQVSALPGRRLSATVLAPHGEV